MNAIISHNPLARILQQPEVVESVDITHCLQQIKQLVEIATIVNKNPSQYDQAAVMMAYHIVNIARAVRPYPMGTD